MPFLFHKGSLQRKMNPFKRSKRQSHHKGFNENKEALSPMCSAIDLKYQFEQASIDQDLIDHSLSRSYHIHTAAANLTISGSGELISFDECDSTMCGKFVKAKWQESNYKCSFKILLKGWREFERYFITPASLNNQTEDAASAGPAGTAIFPLDDVVERGVILTRAARQTSLDIQRPLPPLLANLLSTKVYGGVRLSSKLNILLDRLNQVFDAFSPDKLVLWQEDYCRILRVMVDDSEDDLAFEAAMISQDDFETIEMHRNQDDVASSSQVNNVARLQRAWNEGRRHIEVEYEAEQNVNGNYDDIAQESEEKILLTIQLRHRKNETVKIKVGSLLVADIKRAVSATLNIPSTHQRLTVRHGSALRENEFIKESHREILILDRPLYRPAWCAWSINRIDEIVLKNWTQICKYARKKWPACEGKGSCRLHSCGCEITPCQFCYVDDLYSLVTEYGSNSMSHDEATHFIDECSPQSAAQRHEHGFMTDDEFAQSENQNDLRKRVYYEGYISSLLHA